jgi:hypothetical protein
LIATVFEASPTGFAPPVQQQSTNLSTVFCGYRGIHYTRALDHYTVVQVDAVRKLAAAQRFG